MGQKHIRIISISVWYEARRNSDKNKANQDSNSCHLLDLDVFFPFANRQLYGQQWKGLLFAKI